jgi:hypothetical protein
MGATLGYAVCYLALAVPIVAALYARKKYFAAKPQVGAVVVVVAGAVGILFAVIAMHLLQEREDRRRYDGVLDGLCKSPRAGDEIAQAYHDLACSPDTRVADLRGASEYQAVWVHLATREDTLSVFAPRPDMVQAPPAGKAYHLWMLDGAGTVVEHARLDRTMSTLIRKRPDLAKAVKAVITLDVPGATKPDDTIVVQGNLEHLR